MFPADEEQKAYLIDIAMFYMDAKGIESYISDSFSLDDFKEQLSRSHFSKHFSDEHYAYLTDLLGNVGLVTISHDKYAGSFYQLGIEYSDVYNHRSKTKGTPLANCETYGNQWAKQALDGLFEAFDESDHEAPTQQEELPASDRTVTLTDNQFSEAKQTLEETIKEFQKDHHFGNEWVAEKNALLKALENGKEYLDAKTMDVRIGTMMVIEPLQAIAEKYKKAAVNGSFSALAQKALEFFINLFAG